MPTEAQLISALRQADAAGDGAGAKRIAQMIASQRQQGAPDPVTGFLTTAARAIPGLTELGAGYSAAVNSADDALHGRPVDFVGRFNQARQQQTDAVQGFQRAHPVASNLATAVGGVAPVAATMGLAAPEMAAEAAPAAGRTLAQRAARAGSVVAKNALTGAGVSATYGFAQPGTLAQRSDNAMRAVVPGAVLGAALPAAAGAAGKVVGGALSVARGAGALASEAADGFGRLASGASPADQAAPLSAAQQAQGRAKAVQWLQRQGVTSEALEAAAARAGNKPITTAEAMGPNGISQVTGLARRAGTTPDMAATTMASRADDRAARILNDLHETTGVDPVAARGDMLSLVKNGRAEAAPLYDAAYAQPAPQSDEIDALMQRPSMRAALGRAVRIAQEEGRDPTSLGFDFDPEGNVVNVRTPSVQTLDYVKRGLDDVLNSRRDQFGRLNLDEEGRAVLGTLNDFRSAITNPNSPAGKAYGAALDASGDYMSAQDAYNRAKGQVFSPSRDPRDFADWFSGLKPGDQKAVQASVANDVFGLVNNGRLMPRTFEPPAVQQKLATVFGPESAANLIDRMNTEANMSRASARMTPNLNSTTGDVIGSQADGPDALGGALQLGGAAINAVSGRPLAAARGLASAAAPYISAARLAVDQGTRNALGDILLQDPRTTASLLRSAASGPSPTYGSQLLTGARMAIAPPTNAFAPPTISALSFAGPAAMQLDQSQQPSQ